MGQLTATAPSAPPTAPVISLRSRLRGLRIPLEADDIMALPNGGYRMLRKGAEVRFSNGRATVTPEEWELLREHPIYTGQGQRKEVWREDELIGVPAFDTDGPRVVDGAQHSAISAPKEPIENFSRLTPKQIESKVKSGQLTDIDGALQFELAGRNRDGVKRVLMQAALATGTAEEVREAIASATGDVAETVSVETPGEGVL
jgi:hypothetical protein